MVRATRLFVTLLAASGILIACAQGETGGVVAEPNELPEVVQQFVTSINAGDAEAVAATFAEDAVFDSVGRIYDGCDDTMNRFLIPEVIELGGQYEVLDVTEGEGGRVVVEFNFQAGSLREHFTYDFLIEDGLIRDVVGRYV